MNIKLDLAKFKHKESGKDSTTLEHETDGHCITLSHGKLSKEHKAQLEALRDATKSKKKPKDQKPTENEHDAKKPIKMASGGQVPYKLEEEVPVTEQSLIPTESDLGAISEQKAQHPDPNEFLPSKVLQPVQREPAVEAPKEPEVPKPADFVSQKAGQQGLNEYARLDEPQRQEYLSKIGYGVPKNEATSPQASPEARTPASPEGMVQPGQAPQLPVQEPATPQSQATPTQTAPVIPQAPKPSDDYMQEAKHIEHDFAKGHITPKTYSSMYANKSTLGKIGTIFGLLISGAGSGLAGQKNAVMDMMDKEIQQDLDAQVATKSNQMNFMKLAEEHVMNQAQRNHLTAEDKIKARALAQKYAYMSTYDKLAKQTQSMPEGQAKINALNALAGVAKSIQDKDLMTGSMLDTQFEALKRSPQMLGDATEAEKSVDTHYAKDYEEFITTGKNQAETSLANLEALIADMEKDTGFGEAGGGKFATKLPDYVRATKAIERRDTALNEANQGLKAIFGSQNLTDADRISNAKAFYNDSLDNKANIKILKGKTKALRESYNNKIKQAQYYENKRTLRGSKWSEPKAPEKPSNSREAAKAWLNSPAAKTPENKAKADQIRKLLGQ